MFRSRASLAVLLATPLATAAFCLGISCIHHLALWQLAGASVVLGNGGGRIAGRLERRKR